MDKIDWRKVNDDTRLMVLDLVDALRPTRNDKINYTMTAFNYPPKIVLLVQAAGTSDLDKLFQQVGGALTPVIEKWGMKCKSYWTKNIPHGWDRAKTYYLHLDYSKYKMEAK